jgi:nitrate reductase beta subunit
MDRVPEIANVPNEELVKKQREIILDPNDPKVVAAARAAGISEHWIEACRRSPVYKMVKQWEIALPLHPEFRTLPSLFYVPPESPVRTASKSKDLLSMIETKKGVLPSLSEFRIPIKFLSSLLAAGNEGEVEKALVRQLAVRAFRRSERVEKTPDVAVLKAAGLSVEDARGMHRLLALAHFHERYVIPTTRRERTANAPYIERGFAGYSELGPSDSPKRRSFFHGGDPGVGS